MDGPSKAPSGASPQDITFYLDPDQMRELYDAVDKYDEDKGWNGKSDIRPFGFLPWLVFRLRGTLE